MPEDVSREVQSALIAIGRHASVGRAILDCQTNHNETFCETTTDLIDEEVRCDTNTEIALAAVDAVEKGKYSGWQTTLSYMQLRSMQEGTGFIKQDEGTNIWRCVRAIEIYDSITCPEGFYRKTKEEVSNSCALRGLECQEGYQCLCSPCAETEVCYDGVEFRGDCVSYKVFLPALLIPIFVLILIFVQCYVSYKRRMADAVWEVKEKELLFDNPPTVIGVGTFGYVLLAEYRGTQVCISRRRRFAKCRREPHMIQYFVQVAVKRVLPPGKREDIDQPTRDVESNPGLQSVVHGRVKRSLASGSVGHSAATRSMSPSQIKNDLVQEMRQLSKLRHPVSFYPTHDMVAIISWLSPSFLCVLKCITTVMGMFSCNVASGKRNLLASSHITQLSLVIFTGAVLNRSSDPMLIMEYLAFGSLYDVLRDASLQTQVDENQMHFLQDIA